MDNQLREAQRNWKKQTDKFNRLIHKSNQPKRFKYNNRERKRLNRLRIKFGEQYSLDKAFRQTTQ